MNNKNSENSTFEMETRESFNRILEAIGSMRQDVDKRFDKIEKRLDKIEVEQAEMRKDFTEFKTYAETQFEAIRQGLVKNYNRLDQLEAQIAENRMVIFNTKALVGELNERVYLLTKSSDLSLK